MQKRVAPAARARSAACTTSSRLSMRAGCTAGRVAGRLGTVRAVFLARAGLHRKQGTELHLVGSMMLAVHLLRAEEQFRQGQIVDGPDFLDAKVVAKLSGHATGSTS